MPDERDPNDLFDEFSDTDFVEAVEEWEAQHENELTGLASSR